MAEQTDANPTQETHKEAPAVSTPELEKLLEKTAQSAADRVRTEYSQKLREAQTELETLRTEKMTAKEKAEHESAKLREQLEEKAKKLNLQELKLLATQELKEKGLDIDFIEYVIGSDADGTKDRIAKLKTTFDAALSKAVDSQMKAHGRDPNKGRSGSAETSGFAGMTGKEIQVKAREDPAWFKDNESAILKAMAQGQIKRS